MYESPITQIFGKMTMKYEDDCFKAVQSYGFTVNKEELTKALQYDRGQYTKGYNDGYTKAIEEFVAALKAKAEQTMNNPDIHLECKKCTIWQVKVVDDIAKELKGE